VSAEEKRNLKKHDYPPISLPKYSLERDESQPLSTDISQTFPKEAEPGTDPSIGIVVNSNKLPPQQYGTQEFLKP